MDGTDKKGAADVETSETCGANKPLRWNYHSKHGWFRQEAYYAGLLFLICVATVAYCKSDLYSIGLERILSLGKALSGYSWGLSTIINGPYDIKTKEYYSLFYLFFPVYFLLGLLSSFFISPYRYKRMIVDISGLKILFILFLSLFVFAPTPILAPIICFNGPTYLVIFNATMAAATIYGAGVVIVAFLIKSNI